MTTNNKNTSENDDLYDIVFDTSFLGNAVSAQMQLIGEANDNEFFEIQHIELEGDRINIIARKFTIAVN